MMTPRLLIVSDPVLHSRLRPLIQRHAPSAHWCEYTRGDRAGGAAIRHLIREGYYALLLSVYCDLILGPAELNAVPLPLNIHPALPHLPGMGYDVLPLIQEHRTCGATLHRMTLPVDSGPVYDTHTLTLSPGGTYPTLRHRNQQATLRLCEKWLPVLGQQPTASDLERTLDMSATDQPDWHGPCVSRQAIIDRLQRLWRSDPERCRRLELPITLWEQPITKRACATTGAKASARQALTRRSG